MHVVIETSKEQMKYLFSDCRQSPWQMPQAFVFFVRYWAWGIGAKPVDLEKILQTGNVT